MKMIQRAVSVVCAIALLATATVMSGCSTPAVAMTVDSYECSTGEYLANLYNVYYNLMYTQGLAQYSSYGQDPWDQDMTLGEGESAVQVKTSEYIQVTAQDNVARQEAVRQLMAADSITNKQEELDSVEESLASAKESEMVVFGFNKEHYKQMYIATNLDEKSLFYGWYGTDGVKAVTEEQQRQFYEDNYYSYKSIEISLQDDSGNALSDDQIAAIDARLQGYLDMYNASGDFDAVITQFNADESAAEAAAEAAETTATAAAEIVSDTTATEIATETTSVPVSAEVETSTGVIEGADTAETVTGETVTAETVTGVTTDEQLLTADGAETDATAAADDSLENVVTGAEDETQDSNLKDLKGASNEEATLVEAVKSIPVNGTGITTYNKDGKTKTAVLILRLDPETVHGSSYFTDEYDTLIYNMKWDEFDNLLKEKVATLSVVKNDRAIKMCDPKDFDSVIAKNS